MDDLFKRAAEKFPLKEQASDWNAIGSRLDKSAHIPVTAKSKRPFNFIAIMAALLLHLPFKLFETYYSVNERAGEILVANNKNADELNKDHTIHYADDISITNNVTPQVNYDDVFNHAKIFIEESQHTAAHKKSENSKLYESFEVVDSLHNNIIAIQSPMENNERMEMENNQDNTIPIDTVAAGEAIAIKENIQEAIPDPTLPKDTKQSIKKPLSGWYAGIHTGLSFSIVKGQQLSRPGYTAGIGVGYKLSPSWSLETGLTFSEKKYYSNGAYFIPKNPDPNMPPDMKVVSLNSKTLLLEIPLKAKYDFGESLKGQFFLTGGFNTFIVGKEVNDYIIYRNGSNGTMHATYNENHSYLGAVVDMSVGYEKFFKNKQTLRIEPWIQIARKGIGVGQIPVSGFGVRAGYFFHK